MKIPEIMKSLSIALIGLGAMFSCAHQSAQRVQVQSPMPEEAHQFNFWLGDWDLTWANGSGTNSITRIYGGSVIQEDFLDAKNGFAGGSVSLWRPTENRWRQVWMDNQGSYLSFVGGWDGEQMVLTLDNPKDTPNPDRASRMRWHDIEGDSFVWTYEGSTDEGATWSTLWEILYTRRR